uniref:Uncharacterized protein n=1 Tax=Avena sativa TaxID=4498 RepID=A0ACD5T9P9_AVESA
MLPLLRSVVSGRLRRSLSTAAPRPPWAMMDRETQLTRSPVGVSSSFRPPPCASSITIPVWSFDLERPGDNSKYVDTMRSRLLAASGDGFILLDTYKSRSRIKVADLDLPVEVLLKSAHSEVVYRRFEHRVCNPVTGELFRLPGFQDADMTSTDGMGLLTKANGADRPPERYVAAQLTEVDGGRRFLLRRFSSQTGAWSELVMPSPLPPGRQMHMNHEHEVLDFGGRLWWVDVSWGAVCVDPFSDRPELRAVELPAGSVLPGQQSEAEMRRLVKHRRMGVSAGKICYAEADPFHIRSYTLDDESGRWTPEHQVSVADLWPNVKRGHTPGEDP